MYAKILARDEVRYFGNVTLGRDLSVDDLRARYDQIVYAVGAQSDRRLGIPGEDLRGSHAAFDFVAWYNAHPDFRDRKFGLDCEHVVVIGNGTWRSTWRGSWCSRATGWPGPTSRTTRWRR